VFGLAGIEEEDAGYKDCMERSGIRSDHSATGLTGMARGQLQVRITQVSPMRIAVENGACLLRMQTQTK
jgi:hypothetical protein